MERERKKRIGERESKRERKERIQRENLKGYKKAKDDIFKNIVR